MTRSNKDVQLIANVEQLLADQVWTLVRSENMTMSAYLRSLVLADLKSRGRLTPELLEELL